MKDSKKTPAPESPTAVHVWLVMLKAFQSVAQCLGRKLRESGLGDSDFRVLEVLLHKGPLPVNTIGPKVFLTPGSISIAVDRLYERGLVSRVDSETDRRVKVVDLTAKGRRLISCVFEAHTTYLDELAADLTPSERLQLIKGLKKFGKKAEAKYRGAV
jgi:MarR family 2-MHQ and catechol resistance regulon transcriptional repressor